MAVYGAEGIEDGGVVREGGGGAVSDGFYVEIWWLVCGLLRGVGGDDLVEDLVNGGGGGDELGGVGGADVEERGGGLGDGVDGGAAGDVADVDGGERVGGELDRGDLSEGLAEEEDGVEGTGVCPGVASGAGDGDAEAEAAESPGDDGGAAAAFERDGGGDAGGVGAAFEEVAHAAEVAFAFFAYVGGEEDGDGWGDFGVTQCGGDGEEAGEAGGVVADAGGVDAMGAFFFDGVDGGVGGKDGVEVGGEEDYRGWEVGSRGAFGWGGVGFGG